MTTEPRDRALQLLYEAEQRHLTDIDVGDRPLKAARLVTGVLEHLEELDRSIEAASTRWRIDRMPPVDRSILRIALYELRFESGTPTAVIVSEAVRLAKTYSTERSGAFVNGVLGRLATEERDDAAGSD